MKSKGMSLLSIQKFAKSFGEEAYENWLNSLPAEAQQAYRWQILPSSWYDTEIFYTPAVQTLTDQHFGGDDTKIGQVLGEASAQFALTGAYRMLVENKDPVGFFRKGTMLMKQYHNPSRLDVHVVAGGQEATMELYELPKPLAVYEYVVLYYIIEAMKMSGYPNVKWSFGTMRSKGAERTEYHFSW